MIVSNLPSKSINDYKGVVGEHEIDKLIVMAEKIRGYSITHVNSTSFGGGVAELLYSLVPIMNSLGIKTEWEVIEAPNDFFVITKKIHNALQGAQINLTSHEKEYYLKINRENVEKILRLRGDYIVVHDPQPLAIKRYYTGEEKEWIWRCHIDLSSPYRPVFEFILSLLNSYRASIFHLNEFIHPEIPTPIKYVSPPSIDPLSDKNRELSETDIERILHKYDIDPEKPIIVQVARFDPWKDPLGAIDVYRLVKEKIPDVQLLLVANMAHDDPESWIYYEKTVRHAGEDYNIYFLTNLVGVGPLEVNAFQRAATVVLQLSIREGFGLAVTEALWKKKPVIARPSGGIKLQVIDGVTGYLVKTVKEAAEKTIYLIKHPEIRIKLGENGYRHVLENFIVTKHIERYLRLFNSLL